MAYMIRVLIFIHNRIFIIVLTEEQWLVKLVVIKAQYKTKHKVIMNDQIQQLQSIQAVQTSGMRHLAELNRTR